MKGIFLSFIISGIVASTGYIILHLTEKLCNRRTLPQARYYFAVFLVFLSLFPFSIHLPETRFEKSKESYKTVLVKGSNYDIDYAGKADNAAISTTKAHTQNELVVSLYAHTPRIISILWLSVASILLIYKLTSYYLFKRRIKKSSEYLSTCHGLKVYKSNEVKVPTLVGFFSPKVYIPSFDIVGENLDKALLHEKIHFDRSDISVKLLILICSCVHWYNPILHKLCKKCAELCELSCDAAVSKSMTNQEKQQYISSLLFFAEQSVQKNYVFTSSFTNGRKILERRLNMVTNDNNHSRKTRTISILVSVFAALCLLLASGVIAGKYLPKNEKKESTKSKDTNQIDAVQSLATDDSNSQNEALSSPDNLQSDTVSEIEIGRPIATLTLSRGYDESHEAVDYKAPKGTEILSPIDGYVKDTGYNSKDGNYVLISDNDGNTTAFMSACNEILVSVNEEVSLGQTIATVGSTGLATGPHLHYELKIDGNAVNPEEFHNN